MIVLLRMSGGKKEKVVGADCKEDIGVGPTNGHKGDKLTPATIFGCMKLGLETSAAERDGPRQDFFVFLLSFLCHYFLGEAALYFAELNL